MSGVKRYDPEGYTQPASRSGTGTHMVESLDGDYVLASDYDMLAQRCRDWELNHALLRDELENERMAVAAFRTGHDTLRAEVETLRDIREIANQCAANGGYLSSADLIELRELLKK